MASLTLEHLRGDAAELGVVVRDRDPEGFTPVAKKQQEQLWRQKKRSKRFTYGLVRSKEVKSRAPNQHVNTLADVFC